MLSRHEIVAAVADLVGPDRVLTHEDLLREYSIDRYRKVQLIYGIFALPLPVAVVRVKDTDQVAAVLRFAHDQGIPCVPRTGGSATEGGLETIRDNTLVLDGTDMNRILNIDAVSMEATVQCGVNLEYLENRLREQGLTLGHSPQSKPLAMMGGLVATRSIGQFSTLYGGIEDMVTGLEAVFPGGRITRIKSVPRRACGPDIRHIVIGNEGALCFITEVTVKLHRYYPESMRFLAGSLPDMATGFALLREVMVAGYRPSLARLYDAPDGAQHGFDQFSPDRCVIMFMTEGPEPVSRATAEGIQAILTPSPGWQPVDSRIIETWFSHLNWGPEKVLEEREIIRKTGNVGFTTEVSGNWGCIPEIYDRVIHRILTEFPHADDLTLLGGHSSHSYQTGTNLYFVYNYNMTACSPEQELETYHVPLNAMIVEETLRSGGAMVHHHGIGKYRTPWTRQEHGSAYYLLAALKRVFDPEGIMNPGTIFPLDDPEP